MKFMRMLAVGWIALICVGTAAAASSQLNSVQVKETETQLTVSLKTSGSYPHKEYRADQHTMLVDLTGVEADASVQRTLQRNSVLLKSYKLMTYTSASGAQVTRLALELGDDVSVNVQEQAGGLELVLTHQPPAAALPAPQPAAQPAANPAAPAPAYAQPVGQHASAPAPAASTTTASAPAPAKPTPVTASAPAPAKQATAAASAPAKPAAKAARASAPVRQSAADAVAVGNEDATVLPVTIAPAQGSGKAEAALSSVSYHSGRGSIDVSIEGPSWVHAFLLRQPDRLVLDFENTVLKASTRKIGVTSKEVRQIRVGRFQAEPPVARIVVDLDAPHAYKVLTAKNHVLVRIFTGYAAIPPMVERGQPAPMLASEKPRLTPAEQAELESAPAASNPAPAAAALPERSAAPREEAAPEPVKVAEAPATQGAKPVVGVVQVVPSDKLAREFEGEDDLAAAKTAAAAKPAAAAPEPVEAAAPAPAAPEPVTAARQWEQPVIPPAPKSEAEAAKAEKTELADNRPALAIAPTPAPAVNPPAPRPEVEAAQESPASTAQSDARLAAEREKLAAEREKLAAEREKLAQQIAVSEAQAAKQSKAESEQARMAMPLHPQGAQPAASGVKYTGEPISVNLKDVDLKDFFRLIHEISGLNIVLDPSVRGSVTLVLDDVPWDQALDIVLKNNQLDRELQGNVLRIAASDTLRKEAVDRRAQSEALALAVDRQTITRFLSYAKAIQVVPTLKKFLSARGDIIQDERTNAVIISDIPSVIPTLDALISKLDRKSQEVEIEVRVVSATRSFSRDLGSQFGFNWGNGVTSAGGSNPNGSSTSTSSTNSGSSGSSSTTSTTTTNSTISSIPLFGNFPASGATSGIFLGNITRNYGIDVILTAAETHNLAKVLSRPRVVTQSNVKAEVKQGVKIPVYTASTANSNASVSYVDAVLRLSVTPQITSDNTIFLQVDVENTQPSGTLNGNYVLTTQQATTQVLVTDGGTVVIGGVIQTTNSVSTQQTPFLGNIPWLGNLFRERLVKTETDELIFFITPKIIQT